MLFFSHTRPEGHFGFKFDTFIFTLYSLFSFYFYEAQLLLSAKASQRAFICLDDFSFLFVSFHTFFLVTPIGLSSWGRNMMSFWLRSTSIFFY